MSTICLFLLNTCTILLRTCVCVLVHQPKLLVMDILEMILSKIKPFVNKWTSKHRGSISVEHGLMKADKLHYSKSSETVLLIAEIKKLLDPSRIMNPNKVLLWSLLFHG